MQFLKRVLAPLLVSALLAPGCGSSDTTPPAAPLLDQVVTPTPEASPTIRGSAEFGSQVVITGGAKAVSTTADPYTARFSVKVPLAPGKNTLSAVAIDAAGNQSSPTTVDVDYVKPGAADQVVIKGPKTIRAGEPAVFDVQVLDVYGNPVSAPSFMLTSNAPSASTGFSAPDTFTFCDLGTFTVTATAGKGGPSASTDVQVVAGLPDAVSLTTTPSPAVVTAGDTVIYSTQVTDQCGNPTNDFVDVFTNAPGAIAAGGTISGLTRSGSYAIVAQVPGTSVTDSKSLLVNADASSTAVVLQLSSHRAFVGVPVGYTVTAVDGFGNPVTTPPTITVPTDAGATVDTTTRTVTFSAVGTQTVTAKVGSATDSDFAVVSNPDRAPPTVSITSPASGALLPSNSDVDVNVSATDDQGLSEILFQASGQASSFQTQIVPTDPVTGLAPTSFNATFSFHIPRDAIGTITLVAQAVDTSGNHTSSTPVAIQADPAAGVSVAGGFTLRTVSIGGQLQEPRGITVDSNGFIYVANNGGNAAVLEIDPTTGSQAVFTPPISNAGPEDIVYFAPQSQLFLTSRSDQRVYEIDSAGVATQFTRQLNGVPGAVIVDVGNTISTMLDNGTVERFDPTASPLSGSVFTMDASTDGSQQVLPNGWGLTRVAAAANAYAGTDRGRDQAWSFSSPTTSGQAVQSAKLLADNPLSSPRDIVQGVSGALYVANSNGRIVRIDLSTCGTASPCPGVATIVSGLDRPFGLAFDNSGRLLITDRNANAVYRMTGSF